MPVRRKSRSARRSVKKKRSTKRKSVAKKSNGSSSKVSNISMFGKDIENKVKNVLSKNENLFSGGKKYPAKRVSNLRLIKASKINPKNKMYMIRLQGTVNGSKVFRGVGGVHK